MPIDSRERRSTVSNARDPQTEGGRPSNRSGLGAEARTPDSGSDSGTSNGPRDTFGGTGLPPSPALEGFSPNIQAQHPNPEIPQLSLPQGGGAIRPIGETFSAQAQTGGGSMSIPIYTSPSRSLYPELSLAYHSGNGNGPFGLGWALSAPEITRKTDRGLPQYLDAQESDTFILSGAEDLVPELVETNEGWIKAPVGTGIDESGAQYRVYRYRPRVEGGFARIERWVHEDHGVTHWRSWTRDNVRSIFGSTPESRVADPQHENKVYAWRLDERRDDRGNIIRFQYKAEDWRNVDRVSGPERERWRPYQEPGQGPGQGLGQGQSQRYLKRIFYGNRQANIADDWAFEVVFNYGDHSGNDPQDDAEWPARLDTFSSFRPGFDLRTRRLCRSVRMYHRFAELVTGVDPVPVLVRETKFEYDENPIATQLRTVQQFGYASESGPLSPEQSYPPTTFGYTAIRVDPTLRIVDHESRIHAPVGVDGQQYRLLDLDGEGLPGILTEQAGHWHYKSPLGEAQFGRAQALPSLPKISSNAGGGPFAAGWQWMDLDGDGQRSLASITGPLPGYFERDPLAQEGMGGREGREGETWRPYQSFRQVPDLDLRDPTIQLLDLNGDGFADILVDEGDAFVWYPSAGRDGFEAPRRIHRGGDERTTPQLIYGSPTIGVYFSDMSGDGLSDIVRVERGRVVYWPNLGYGRFGPEVSMANCPVFEGAEWFRVDRLRLGDVDGSGTTDFLYLGREGARLYANHSGNGFAAGLDLPQLPPVTALESVELADLLGQGTSCLVWSSPRSSSPGMAYLDLAADGKPYLLQSVDNGMGLQTRVQYASSTKYSLADQAAGQPWKTRLPFPVQVIEKVEVYDAVSRRRFSSRYRYRHGYFDGEEREFRGFGRVDQLDTEAFDAESLFEEVETQGEGADVEEAHYVAPVLTKTWFHTGALSEVLADQGHLSRLYVEEYDQRDPEFASLLLADTVAPEVTPDQPPLLAEELREAVRALRGRPLRVEVFSPDLDSGEEGAAYLVTETNFSLQRLQPNRFQNQDPKHAPKHAVFLATERETLSVHYERNPQDPRVSHKAVVEEDAYGTPLRVVSVVYSRRSAFVEHEEQGRLAMVLSELRVEHDDDPARSVYRLAVPIESKRFELTAEPESASVPFAWSQLRTWADEATELGPEETPTAGSVEKRLLSWAQSYYYDEATLSTPDTASALPLGQLGDHALLFHTQVAAWSEGQWAQHIGDCLERSVLTSEGGYVSREGYDWIVSGRAWWDPNALYLLKRAYDPFFETGPNPAHLPQVFEYDTHHLLLVSARDALGNQVHAIPDYRVLAPVEVTDPNGNTSEVQFDALGRVEAVALRGKNGEGDSLAEPTASFVYDAQAWVERGEAVSVRQRLRRQHGVANDGFEARVEYMDGGGNVALAKVQAEDGPASRFDEDGNLIVVPHSTDRWVGTGRTVLDNKGNVIKQYEPYFVEGEQFDEELALTQHGVTPVLHYDPLGRNVRTDFPNQSFAKVAFSPWEVRSFDANDTVLESTWYERRTTGDLASELFERQAAVQTEAHANTPSERVLDSQGRVFRSVEHNRVDDVDVFYTTRLELDIEGNPTRILSARSHTDGSPLVAETRGYGMGGIPLTTSSPEAGTRYAVPNVLGQALRQVDTRDGVPRTQRVVYDGLNRPVLTAMASGGVKSQIDIVDLSIIPVV